MDWKLRLWALWNYVKAIPAAVVAFWNSESLAVKTVTVPLRWAVLGSVVVVLGVVIVLGARIMERPARDALGIYEPVAAAPLSKSDVLAALSETVVTCKAPAKVADVKPVKRVAKK